MSRSRAEEAPKRAPRLSVQSDTVTSFVTARHNHQSQPHVARCCCVRFNENKDKACARVSWGATELHTSAAAIPGIHPLSRSRSPPHTVTLSLSRSLSLSLATLFSNLTAASQLLLQLNHACACTPIVCVPVSSGMLVRTSHVDDAVVC